MSDFAITCEWLTAGSDDPELRETASQLTFRIGGVSLTQNEDVWSRTVRNSVFVSAYPLAIWMAASWWRLNYEPLPRPGTSPVLDWRMGHELGAANHGYVWPHVVLAPDGEVVQVWAVPSDARSRQSVRFLAGLPAPRSVAMKDFQREVDGFIGAVLSRLRAVGHPDTDLAGLWRLVMQDRADVQASRVRRIEAQMGYDPEECPEPVMAEALLLEERMGSHTLSELAPVYGKRDSGAALGEISRLAEDAGLHGKPKVSPVEETHSELPWQRGVRAARTLRHQLGLNGTWVDDETLYGLLGLKAEAVENWWPPSRHQVGLAIPVQQGSLKFVPRKRHPIAKRFEFSRFLGDFIGSGSDPKRWLASTDLTTSRQKYQRAFAAEFLCPIDSLTSFLEGDFSESAVEEAGIRFGVSDQTVESLLANNGYTSSRFVDGGLPYRLAPQNQDSSAAK